MRFIYILFFILAVLNLLLVLISGILNINLYKKYGKDILKGIFKILLIFSIAYIAVAISGLSI